MSKAIFRMWTGLELYHRVFLRKSGDRLSHQLLTMFPRDEPNAPAIHVEHDPIGRRGEGTIALFEMFSLERIYPAIK
jgi:hypothetical protein